MKLATTTIRRVNQEGREARKAGRPRVDPYAGIAAFRKLGPPWLAGWDSMDGLESRSTNAGATKETRS